MSLDQFATFCINPTTTARRECCLCSAALLLCSAALLPKLSTIDVVVFLGATTQEPPEPAGAGRSRPDFLIRGCCRARGWGANWADSEDPRGNFNVWLAWEHYFSKVVLWLTPNVGSGLPWRKLLPHVDAPTAAQATRINTLGLLHWPRRSPCSNCCTRHTD